MVRVKSRNWHCGDSTVPKVAQRSIMVERPTHDVLACPFIIAHPTNLSLLIKRALRHSDSNME